MAQLIVFLPLLAAIVVGLNTRKLPVAAAQWITCLAVSIAAVLAWVVFYKVIVKDQSYTVLLFNWIASGSFTANWALKIDALTAIMLVLVTNVSALVHIYSVGYMSHDKHRQRFMAYLSLFTFFMLMLVTSDNFIQLYLGWEGVGLASYLLIGFWYHKASANAAAIKAFVVNRVGDFGMALGVFAAFMLFDSVQFDAIFAQAEKYKDTVFVMFGQEWHALTVICVLLFIGAMGKSAQLFLHTWLPDAMEGPTPVSALIHAATMVTAGVFLVARCSPLFELAPLARDMVTVIGASTCFFAATVALTQNDIKRVIAYSTCSQLGYMFFACGVGAYAAGIFHLFTHGFFKALLFLGSGSVIHAMSNEQDMRNMGGLWKKIPLTYALMLIGTLAITGFPFLSGFYSKEAVLLSAYAAAEHGSKTAEYAFWLGLAAATLTAFYSWRLIFLTFHGESRASEEVQHHVHESPKIMTVPLILLSVGALLAGAIFEKGLHIVGGSANLEFWNGALVSLGEFNVLDAMHHAPHWIMWASIAVGAGGFLLAYLAYLAFPALPGLFARMFRPLYLFSYNKWYFDELYEMLFVRPARSLGRFLWQRGDIGFIDRFGPDGFSNLSQSVSKGISRVQNGLVYHYAFFMLIGLLLIASWFFLSFLGRGGL